ncbi:MAG: GGDEF domain-containing protein [Marinicella sp.]
MRVNIAKIIVVVITGVIAATYDHYFLEEITDYRLFNIIAEFSMALLAVFLFLAIDQLHNRKYYQYLNLGFYLAFFSMLMDGLDELHIHNELYTAFSEKLTLVVAFVLIILGIRRWIAEFTALNHNLEKQVITDDLTQLYNRRGFLRTVRNMEIIGQKNGQVISFIIADLDDFKAYNDSMGHLEGDELLRKLGQFLKSLMKENQIVGRWGGEEFAFCILNGELPEVVKLAENIRKAVSDYLKSDQFGGINITFSLGVAQVVPGESFMEAIKRADQSLYVAKNQGKNQVVTLNH